MTERPGASKSVGLAAAIWVFFGIVGIVLPWLIQAPWAMQSEVYGDELGVCDTHVRNVLVFFGLATASIAGASLWLAYFAARVMGDEVRRQLVGVLVLAFVIVGLPVIWLLDFLLLAFACSGQS